MAGVKRFEDLVAWQKARALAIEVYRVAKEGELARDFGLRDQITRAAVSVMSNIAEGFERNSQTEFHRFLVIAKGSCAEVRSQLYLAKDIGYLNGTEFELLMSQTEEVGKYVSALRTAVQKRRDQDK